MHALHRRLQADASLQSAVFGLSEQLYSNTLRLGLVLDLNPLWLTAYRFEEAGLGAALLGTDPEVGLGPALTLLGALGLADGPRGEIDYARQFDIADQWSRRVFGSSFKDQFVPFLVRIVCRPVQTDGELAARDQLVAAARASSLPTVVETREPARLVGAAGSRIGVSTGGSGTLGGFLKEMVSGKTYAATCGHVIGKGATVPGDPTLSACAWSWPPTPMPASTRCYALCPTMTVFDLSLMEATAASAVNVATRTAGTVYRGDPVEMHGGQSGVRRYVVGGACVGFEIGGACWDKVFELRPPISPGVIAPGLQLLAHPPPTNGDSGSWVIRNQTEWCGVVVAADELFGYATPEDVNLSQAGAAMGVQLDLA